MEKLQIFVTFMTISVTRASTSEPVSTPEPQIKGDGVSTQDTDVEPPFTEYEKINKHPYIVDHFKLGDTWQDSLGGFDSEVRTIEDYFKGKIASGEMKNDIASVKDKLKGIYKLCGIDQTERTTMQIEKLSAYIEFLKKTDSIKLHHTKYGGSN